MQSRNDFEKQRNYTIKKKDKQSTTIVTSLVQEVIPPLVACCTLDRLPVFQFVC